MAAEQPCRVKHTRRGGSKSHFGCLTCRIRRIKCDETKPHCKRCTSSGRKCEGPLSFQDRFVQENPAAGSSSPRPSSSAVSTRSPYSSHIERHSFDFFIGRVAPALSGVLDSFFWEDLVPKLSHSQPAIRNAVLAISRLYEHPPRPAPLADHQTLRPITDPDYRQAINWYNAAIACFNRDMGKAESVVALITCLLFICVELLQDEFVNAMMLLQKGLAVHHTRARSTSHKLSPIDKTINEFYTRLAMQLKTFMQEPQQNATISDVDKRALDFGLSSFDTLEEAKRLQQIIRDECLSFLRRAAKINRDDAQAVIDLAAWQRDLSYKLAKWLSVFEKIVFTTTESKRTAAALLTSHEGLQIWVLTRLSPHESAFDDYRDKFESIVNNAEIALGCDSSDGPCTLDAGPIIPLHLVAVKCDDAEVRRRALALLTQCPPRYNSILKARAADAIVTDAPQNPFDLIAEPRLEFSCRFGLVRGGWIHVKPIEKNVSGTPFLSCTMMRSLDIPS